MGYQESPLIGYCQTAPITCTRTHFQGWTRPVKPLKCGGGRCLSPTRLGLKDTDSIRVHFHTTTHNQGFMLLSSAPTFPTTSVRIGDRNKLGAVIKNRLKVSLNCRPITKGPTPLSPSPVRICGRGPEGFVLHSGDGNYCIPSLSHLILSTFPSCKATTHAECPD